MPKSDLSFDTEDYAPVSERITLFYERYPTGRILTELLSPLDSSEIVVKASVFRSEESAVVAATGLAAERRGDGDVNTVACLENTETSAIGRALANLGLTASRQRPSREEIQKADRTRRRTAGNHTAAIEYSTRPGRAAVSEAPIDDSAQQRADAAADALMLLAEAERTGMRPARVGTIRTRLLHDASLGAAEIDRVQLWLRQWLIKQDRPSPESVSG
jgi:hypothetical protein